MRVAQVTRFGGPEVIETVEVPDPVPGPGEAVTEVAAVDTIFMETQIRAGQGAEFWGKVPPYVPGGAAAGIVKATGPGVDQSWHGRAVAAHTGSGSYAEQPLASVEDLIPLPEGLDPYTAAALLHDGPTALGLFANAQVKPGESVLVLPAAGGARDICRAGSPRTRLVCEGPRRERVVGTASRLAGCHRQAVEYGKSERSEDSLIDGVSPHSVLLQS